jgi:uncharacterized protein
LLAGQHGSTVMGEIQKYHLVLGDLRSRERLLVAFSGGVDSSLLVCAASEALGDRCLAVTVRSPLHPEWEAAQASAVADHLGVRHHIVEMNELDREEFRRNPPNRCYLCKLRRLKALVRFAKDHGYAVVAEGSNADDSRDFRPGSRAVRELGVLSPLADAGLTKTEIRELARMKGLPNWDAPAMACLASRVPYRTALSPRILKQVNNAEQGLREMGFRIVRVRHHGDVGRVELPIDELHRALRREKREKIVSVLKEAGYRYVSLDLEGYRTGAMNEVLDSKETEGKDIGDKGSE